MSVNEAQTKVAIMAASEQNHSHLSTLLGDAGLDVVMHDVAGDDFIQQLEQTSADVLLVDLCDDDASSEVDVIDTLLEYDSLPVLFNDSSKAGGETNAMWAKKLARKLEKMAQDFEPKNGKEPELELLTEQQPVLETGSKAELVLETIATDEVSADDTTELSWESQSIPDAEEDTEVSLALAADTDLELAVEDEDSSTDDLSDANKLSLVNDLELEESPVPALEPKKEFSLKFESEPEVTESPQGSDHAVAAESFSNIEDEISEEIETLPQHDDGVAVASKEKSSISDMPEGAAVNVWVLGASLGGPQAVRQFLMAIKEDLPVAFVLAQHIGENHISLLGEQLDRVTAFKVFPGYNGHMIRHHEVILAPPGKNIHITTDGYISLSDQEADAIYSPCINDVMTAVAKRYGDMAGTIVFSGMGDDGSVGCQSVAENGGIVWAQDVDSCVISSMPDQARKTNNVTFSANPRQLADELYKYYKE